MGACVPEIFFFGGLGIHDLRDFNLCLMASGKRYFLAENQIWNKIVGAKYNNSSPNWFSHFAFWARWGGDITVAELVVARDLRISWSVCASGAGGAPPVLPLSWLVRKDS